MNDLLRANKLAALAALLGDRLDRVGEQLSPTAMATLLTLRYWAPLTTSALARLLQVSQPNAVRVIDGLVRAGFVNRASRQGREVALSLTDEGTHLATQLQESRLESFASLLETLDPKDQSQFEALVDKLLANATDGRRSARRTCRFCAHDICDGEKCPVGTRATEIDGAFAERA